MRLPLLITRRLAHLEVEGPWMVPEAVSCLNRLIDPNWTVLEVGSGRSTSWLAQRSRHVTSLEHNPVWHARTLSELTSRGLANVELHLVEANRVADGVRDLSDESVDLLIVDGLDRMQCVREGAAKVRGAGVLVLDDSDLPEHAEADTLLSGWRVERFVGLKQSPLLAVETSIYHKP